MALDHYDEIKNDTMTKQKETDVLVIGLDAADKDLIAEWANAGYLPTFKKLMQTAAWGMSENPPGLYVGAVWPSFYTGVSPAYHGRYCYKQLKSGTYDTYTFRPHHVQTEPFWKGLSDANKRVALVDVPKTQIVPDIDGVQIIDWAAHDPDHYTGFVTEPASLAKDVLDLFGKDEMADCNAFRYTEEEFVSFRDTLIERAQTKTDLAKHYLKQGGWDAFVVVFAESHCVAHQCWHVHDQEHLRHDPSIRAAIGDPVKDIYIALDKAVAELLETVGPDTPTIVLASHGFTRHYDATHLLDEVLQKLDEGHSADVPEAVQQARKSGRGVRQVLLKTWRRLPKGLRKLVLPVSGRARQQMRLDPMAQRGSFQIPNNDAYGGVRVNLVGREPQGLIQPEEYDNYCRRLADDLRAIVNVDTGEPIVTDILFTKELYDGPLMDDLPDLMLKWNRASPISSVTSPKIGTVSGEYNFCRTGDHKREGVFFMTGEQIVPGQLDTAVDVMDYSATIADMLNVELPHVQGVSFLSKVQRRSKLAS